MLKPTDLLEMVLVIFKIICHKNTRDFFCIFVANVSLENCIQKIRNFEHSKEVNSIILRSFCYLFLTKSSDLSYIYTNESIDMLNRIHTYSESANVLFIIKRVTRLFREGKSYTKSTGRT